MMFSRSLFAKLNYNSRSESKGISVKFTSDTYLLRACQLPTSGKKNVSQKTLIK